MDERETRGTGSLERLVRPVRCYLCNQPMHYAGQPGHVPEVWVEVHGEDSSDFYAHVSCWNRIVAARTNDQSSNPHPNKTL
jgi:hypothetical protein